MLVAALVIFFSPRVEADRGGGGAGRWEGVFRVAGVAVMPDRPVQYWWQGTY